MNYEDKQAMRARYERVMKKHYRSRDEERLLQAQSRARKAERRPTRRRRVRAEEAEEHDDFEKIRRVGKAPAGMDRERIAAVMAGSAGAPPDPSTVEPERTATVVAVHRTRVVVRPEAGDRAELDVRPPQGGPLAIGDRIVIERNECAAARLENVFERRSVLARPDPSAPERQRVLAANVDVGVVVASVREPALRPGLVDRIVVALGRGNVEPLVLLNKADLVPDAAGRAAIGAELATLAEAGVRRLWTSAATGEGLDELAAALVGRTCVLVGHSGVGKSSLLNVLDPTAEQDTGTGRAYDGKGRHTTSASRMVELPDGTRLIDTPGVRLFALWESDGAELAAAFPDVESLAEQCRFRDCRHAGEPGCTVRAALEAGELAAERLEAWRRIVDSFA